MDKINATKRLTNKLYGFPGVYMITINEHTYIGSTKNMRNRWKSHLNHLSMQKHKNYILQKLYNEFGREKMFFSILEKCNTDLLQREKFWIDVLEPDININKDPTLNDNSWQYNKNGKMVFQYDLNGNFIRQFNSTKEVERELGFISNAISAVANTNISKCKSAYGFLWSYTKLEKPKYQNNSKFAKIKGVTLFDILEGKEYKFNSSIDAARNLFKNDYHESISATIISSCRGKGIIKERYIAKYSDNKDYIIPKKCLPVINIKTKEVLQNRQILYKKYDLSVKRLKKNKDWLPLINYAVIKLRESGKTISDGNPNPSITEM